MMEPPGSLKSALRLLVDERIELEVAAAGAEAQLSLPVESAAYPSLSHLISFFSVVTDFRGLMQSLDRCMRSERDLVERLLTYSKC